MQVSKAYFWGLHFRSNPLALLYCNLLKSSFFLNLLILLSGEH